MANVGFIKVTFLFCLLFIFFLGLFNFIYNHDSGHCDRVTVVKRLQFSVSAFAFNFHVLFNFVIIIFCLIDDLEN